MTKENKGLTAQDKKEIEPKKEHTTPLKAYLPATDIVETADVLMVYMDMPGVSKDRIAIKLEKSMLRIDGEIDTSPYSGIDPLYTEYNIGNFTRQFELSNKVDQSKIEAKMHDGVLTITLPKVAEIQPKMIDVN